MFHWETRDAVNANLRCEVHPVSSAQALRFSYSTRVCHRKYWVFLHTSTTEGNCTNLTSYANCRYAPQPRLSGTARILCRRTSLTLKQLEQPESRRGVVQFWSTRVESPPPLHPHRYRICRLVYTPSVQSLYLTLASSDRVFP